MHENAPGLTNAIILDVLKLVFEQEPASAVLVGGQALAFWVLALEVPVPEELPPTVTRDLDILCSMETAIAVHKRIGGKFFQATADDVTPNLARLSELINGVPIDIDFMKGILGVRNEALVKKSIVLSLAEPNIKIRVMHPYTIWLSRLENLISIKEKRTPYGVAQANLSLAVLKQFILSQVLGADQPLDTIYWMRHALMKFKSAKARDAVVDFNLCFSDCYVRGEVFLGGDGKKYDKICAKIERLIAHAAKVKNERMRKIARCGSIVELNEGRLEELIYEAMKCPRE